MSVVQVFVLFIVFVATACAGVVRQDEPAPASTVELPECTWADVVRITDGDTIVVKLSGVEARVRYIGIDTPEMANFGNPEEPFARAAKTRNGELLKDKRVCLERDVSETDQFDRLLRYAWLADGQMVNEALLREGLAVVATYPPDVKYIEPRFLAAQRVAREEGLGIWGE